MSIWVGSSPPGGFGSGGRRLQVDRHERLVARQRSVGEAADNLRRVRQVSGTLYSVLLPTAGARGRGERPRRTSCSGRHFSMICEVVQSSTEASHARERRRVRKAGRRGRACTALSGATLRASHGSPGAAAHCGRTRSCCTPRRTCRRSTCSPCTRSQGRSTRAPGTAPGSSCKICVRRSRRSPYRTRRESLRYPARRRRMFPLLRALGCCTCPHTHRAVATAAAGRRAVAAQKEAVAALAFSKWRQPRVRAVRATGQPGAAPGTRR